ncbi:MAG: PAS domain-containing protein [Rhodospirillales bacterium]|nr:PAS domain-containing protein [Rhodospirillales bacterium]
MNQQTICGRLVSPCVVSLGYAGIGVCWILVSDRPDEVSSGDLGLFALIQTFGDWLFFLATAALIFVLMRMVQKRADNELASLRAVLDHSPASIAMTDTSGRFVVVNAEFQRRYGVSEDAAIGKTVEELFPKRISQDVNEQVREISEKGEVAKRDLSVTFADGTEHTLEVTRFPIPGADGKSLGIGSISIDVTERTRANAALAESESLLRAIIDNCPLVIALKDMEGRYQLVNKKAKATSDLYSEEIYGKTGFDFRPRGDAEFAAAKDREVMDTGKPVTYEVWNRLTDGADHHFLVTKFPVFDGNGEMTGVGMASLESTNMKKAQDALKESETLFRNVIDNSPLSIGLKDLEGRYRLINRRYRESLGAVGEEYRGKKVGDYRSAAVVEEVQRRDREVMESRRAVTYEATKIGRDGKVRYFLTNRFPVFDAQGDMSGIGFTSLDVSERVDAERRVQEMQSDFAHVSRLSTLGEMAAGFAHELNQPLAAIRNYAAGSIRRIDARHGDISDVRVVIERIAEQAARAGDIIMRIRKFIRKEEGEKNSIDVASVIHDSIGLLYGETLKHNAEIVPEMADNLPRVVADVVQIQQVIINLVRNGLEAMDNGEDVPRCVTIRANQEAECVRVEVEDQGSGISDEVRERLFEPFFTTKGDGMGIGLLICQTIVEEHGGTLAVTQASSGGTVVSFTLPVRDSGQAAEN